MPGSLRRRTKAPKASFIRSRHCTIRRAKQFHDIAGYYNHFDVFDLKINRKQLTPISFVEENLPDTGGNITARATDASSSVIIRI